MKTAKDKLNAANVLAALLVTGLCAGVSGSGVVFIRMMKPLPKPAKSCAGVSGSGVVFIVAFGALLVGRYTRLIVWSAPFGPIGLRARAVAFGDQGSGDSFL